MSKKYLFVVSNHPVDKWSAEQKAGWDDITHLPFPNVPPEWDREQVKRLAVYYVKMLISHIQMKVGEEVILTGNQILGKKSRKDYSEMISISVQGEFTFTCEMVKLLNYPVIFPTTERIAEEVSPGVKRQVFKFSRWR